MGGKPIRYEPQVLIISDAARAILERLGWTTYFMRMQQPHEAVATEFLLNLQEGSSIVRGRNIAVSDEIIAEVSGIPVQGTTWTQKKIRIHEAMKIFQDDRQMLTIKGRGVQPASLGEPWTELAKIV